MKIILKLKNSKRKAWYLDEDVLLEGYVQGKSFYPDNPHICGFGAQELTKKMFGRDLFFDLDEAFRVCGKLELVTKDSVTVLDDNRMLAIITAAQREAGELIMQAHHVITERKSSGRDVVTEYDRRVQELLIERICEGVEDARFFCEENDRQDDLGAEHVFIIDPIDGTMNFVQQFNHSCISVAYMSRGVLRAAAIYNPYVNEMFTAILGRGAMLNGREIHVADIPLAQSVVCCGTAPYNPEMADKTFALIKAAFLRSLDIRRQGAAALDLCSAAAGRAGLYFEPRVSLWDFAAGALIVQEAGGACLTIEGEPLPLDGSRPSIAAGSPRAVDEFVRMAAEI